MNKTKTSLHITNAVLEDLVGLSALQCYGVVAMAIPNAADGISKILPASRFRRGIHVVRSESLFTIDIYIIIEYGVSISVVTQNLSDQLSFAIKELTGLTVDCVNVHVQGVKVH